MITIKREEEDEVIKRPRAPFDNKPEDWPEYRPDGRKAYWPSSWDVPQAWGTFEQAHSYLDRHAYGRNLCFVTHSGTEEGKVERWVCVDIDKAFDESGGLLQGVQDFLDSIDPTYVEVSVSGKGLHVLLLVQDCTLFRTVHQAEFYGAKADILFSGQVVITGNTLPFYSAPEIATLTEEAFLELFPHIDFKERGELGDSSEYDWSQAPEDVPEKWEHLVRDMEAVDCIEGQGGQKELFRAACKLARAGVPIEESEPLLKLCNSVPPWSTRELHYIAECAYRDCDRKGETGSTDVYQDFEPVTEQAEAPKKVEYLFTPIPADELEAMDLKLDWVVEDLLVDKEPLMIGGREKCFKTSVAMDLAISLTTATPFLGSFGIKSKRRVIFFTGEIGPPACKNLMRRIRISKGVEEGNIGGLTIVTTVPTFTNRREVLSLQKYLENERPEVVVFDPLYFCMMGAEVGNMYQIGHILKEVVELCKSVDAWPWFVHHAKKDQSKEFQPMELGDLYGSGVSAFARQWILSAHSDPYRNGTAKLYLTIGGSSTGDCGLRRLTIDEGVGDELADRRWDVSIGEGGGILVDADLEEQIFQAVEAMGGKAKVRDVALTINRDHRSTKSILSELATKPGSKLVFSNGGIETR